MPDIRRRMESLAYRTQDKVCEALAGLEGAPFRRDSWDRPGGGGGVSQVIQGGRVFEKAGVNVSAVHGSLPPEAVRSMRPHLAGRSTPTLFYATGLSMVVHPANPFAPTMHANLRYFELDDGASWWFGGSADLTPAYLFEEDARHFHGVLKEACERHDPSWYPSFKAWCDRYFYLPHRSEHRGIGGLFWDDLSDRPANELLSFQAEIADTILPAYLPLVERRRDTPFDEHHLRWQQLRRGRYVEFNLVHDRGTVFGLKTGARVDSVLMSLPLHARWEVDDGPAPGTPEAALVDVLTAPREWA